MNKILSRTLLATTMLAGLTMSNAAFAQNWDFRPFVGIAAGNSSYDTKDNKAAIEKVTGVSNVKIGDSATGFKVFAGVEYDRSVIGIDYIRWGKTNWEYTVRTGSGAGATSRTVKTSLSATSILPWFGYKFEPGIIDNLTIIPRIGYALNSGKPKGLPSNTTVKGVDDGLALGVIFEWALTDTIGLGLYIDSVNDVGSLTGVGIRYGF